MGHHHHPHHPHLDAIRTAFWAITGGLVLLAIFIAALGGIGPGEAGVLTVIVCALAVLWAAHAWRRLWSDESASSPAERERRGF